MARPEEITVAIKGQNDASPAVDKATQSIQKFDKSMKDTQRGFRLMRGGAAQLSMQVQDVAVQLQGGTNVMTVFAQQGSQIASLFGAGGAFIGAILAVGAAIGGTLLPRLFDSKTSAEQLRKKLEELGNVMTIDLATDTINLSQKFRSLAEHSKELAEIQLGLNLVKAQRAAREATNATKEAAEEFIGVQVNAADVLAVNKKAFEEIADPANGVTVELLAQQQAAAQTEASLSKLATSFGITTPEMRKLHNAAKDVTNQVDGSVPKFQTLVGEIVKTNRGTGKLTEGFEEHATAVLNSAMMHAEASKHAQQLENLLADLSGGLSATSQATIDAGSEAESFVKSIDKQTAQLGMTKAQTIAYQASLLDLNDAQHAVVATAIERALADEEAKRLEKERIQNAKDLSDADRELARLQKQIADGDLAELEFGAAIIAQRKAKAEASERQAAAMRKVFESLGLATGEEKLRAERDERLAAITELAQAETQIEIDEIELRRRAHEQYGEDLKKLRRTSAKFEERDAVGKTDMVLGELGNMFQGVKANNKKMFAVQKAFNIAQAIMSTYTGATKALETYPPPLSFVMAAAQVTAGLAQVAQIRSQSFEGGGFTGMGSRSGGVDGRGGFPAILHPNETVIDHTKGQGQGITIINNIDATGASGDVDLKIRAAMQETSQQTIATVQDLMRRRRFA